MAATAVELEHRVTPRELFRLLTRYVLLLAALLLLGGCQDDNPRRDELPDAVSETRSSILRAAQEGEYDALRPVIRLDRFLSDYGFGGSQPDPVRRWERLGDMPLRTMAVLLQMPHQVRETNEGTLYQWPRLGPNSDPGDMTAEERSLLSQVMTEAEIRDAILPEVGYRAPRLGILADGTWWFFILDRAP
jgi:hypothetical protein